MGESAALPGRAPPVRAEILHESERTRVTRRVLVGAHGHPQGVAGTGRPASAAA